MNLADLRRPFPPDRISWRVGSMTQDKSKGMALAYIDARDVMGRLDEVAGLHWQCEYVPMPNGTCCCRIGLKIGDEWIWRSNGAINLTDSDKLDQKEMTEKGSYSDAFKRAAVLWGIGQYLYDLDSPWVALDEKKRIIPSEFKRLEALLGGKSSPAPKPVVQPAQQPRQDEDIEQGVRNWTAQRRAEIAEAARIPDLYQWKDTHDSALARLKSKHGAAYAGLMLVYQDKFDQLSSKEVETV
jgi:hypothetical protein